MAKCHRCGAETQLYVSGVPVCLACVDLPQGKRNDTQEKTPTVSET
jgi:hypothetical protein